MVRYGTGNRKPTLLSSTLTGTIRIRSVCFLLGLSFPGYWTTHPFLSFPVSVWVVLKVGGGNEEREPSLGDILQFFCCVYLWWQEVLLGSGRWRTDMLLNVLYIQDTFLHQSMSYFKSVNSDMVETPWASLVLTSNCWTMFSMLTNTFQLEKWLNLGFSFILVTDFINIPYEIKFHHV